MVHRSKSFTALPAGNDEQPLEGVEDGAVALTWVAGLQPVDHGLLERIPRIEGSLSRWGLRPVGSIMSMMASWDGMIW